MKILFTDLDETFLRHDKSASQKNVDALHKLLDRGAYVCLNTGRALDGAKYFYHMLGLDGRRNVFLMSANGALIYDAYRDEILKLFPFPHESLGMVIAHAKELGLYYQAFATIDLLIPEHTEESDYYIGRAHMNYRVVPDMPEGIKEDIIKMLIINLHDNALLQRFRAEFPKHYPEAQVDLFFSTERYLEVATHGVHKGSGVQWLCRHLDIPLSEAVAVGDEENDVPMLRTAGVGIAVQNAKDIAKEAADVVLPEDNEHDAIAAVIDRYFL